MSLDYLRAFEGIPSFPKGGWVGAGRDLPAVLRSRRNVREDADNFGGELSVGALKAIAQRIEDQSRRIVELESGPGGWSDA